jgi:ABC-type sugar transport system permease subunit
VETTKKILMTRGRTKALFAAILKTSVLAMFLTLPVALLVGYVLELTCSESATMTIILFFTVALPIAVVSVGVSAILEQEEKDEREALLDQIWHKNFP